MSLLVFLLMLVSRAEAEFPMALVDPGTDSSQNTTGAASNIAIWLNTPEYLTPVGDVNGQPPAYMSIIFPSAFTIPSIDFASCSCLAARTTIDGDGSFGDSEVVITQGSVDTATNTISFAFAEGVHKGNFYIRFDSSTGILNPLVSGTATLQIVSPDNVTTASKPFYISPVVAPSSTQGVISGTISSSLTGEIIPSVLVYATNNDTAFFHNNPFGPTASTVSAYNTTVTSRVRATDFDGSYTMTLPYGDYSLVAVTSYYDGSGLVTYSSVTKTTTISSGVVKATLDFTLPVN